jgi:hypothetical protein
VSIFFMRLLWFDSELMALLLSVGIVVARDCENLLSPKPGPGALMGVFGDSADSATVLGVAPALALADSLRAWPAGVLAESIGRPVTTLRISRRILFPSSLSLGCSHAPPFFRHTRASSG